MLNVVARGALLLLIALILGGAAFFGTAEDPMYTLHETLFHRRFHAYDEDIARVAARRGVDPLLVKAVIWRESRFHPDKLGGAGERGLMQVTEGAAKDWAAAESVTAFVPEDLYDPKTNIEVGTWYLAQALRHWQDRDDPLPFALAEYNAGRSRVKRWSGKQPITADELRDAMDFPGTRAYIASVLDRYLYYKARGDVLVPDSL